MWIHCVDWWIGYFLRLLFQTEYRQTQTQIYSYILEANKKRTYYCRLTNIKTKYALINKLWK